MNGIGVMTTKKGGDACGALRATPNGTQCTQLCGGRGVRAGSRSD
eukprot:SAG25_NODE_21_length_22373_cov_13.904373_29_plen_45_part_00